MVNRLKPLNVMDFTGGVNLRPETFQLAENELPELVNMEVDPRGGINSRKAWVHAHPLPATAGIWNPRNAYNHVTSAGDQYLLVANQTTGTDVEIRGRINGDAFAVVAAAATGAKPHGADFASWDDDVWVVRRGSATFRWDGTTVTTLAASGNANWQNDYTAPGVTDTAPQAALIAQHSGYLFVANTVEDGNEWTNRIRWSHPNNPQRWASSDFIDISEGGQWITGLIPFSDRLLIFKPDSVWALYGYNAETWEVANISRTIGAVNQQVVARSEDAVFFVSWPQGVFAYTEKANVQELSTQIRTIFHDSKMDPVAMENAWIGWVGRRLWCSMPFQENGPTPNDARTVFVFDPVLGSWTMFTGHCIPAPYIERIEANDRQAQMTFVRPSAYAVTLDNETSTAEDLCVPATPHPFETRMRTRWLDAGNPTWKKSWRRPDFLLRALTLTSLVNCQVFHDFNSYDAERSFQIGFTPDSAPAIYTATGDPLTRGFMWGDGTVYGGSDQSTSVERGGTMGRAGALQLLVYGNSGVTWGLNGIIFKFIPRRFR